MELVDQMLSSESRQNLLREERFVKEVLLCASISRLKVGEELAERR
jgi:hypothetical protein